MLKRLMKVLFALLLASAVTACYKPKPNRIVLKYDEEVKLHDGSTIWVQITRRYVKVGALGQGSGYKPTITEVSWDTGMPDIGRKSVFFGENIYLIEKYQDEWYVLGDRYPYPDPKELDSGSVNCKAVGSFFRTNYDCLVVIDKLGNLVKKSQEKMEKIDFFKRNILDMYILGTESKDLLSFKYNEFSWQQKLDIVENKKPHSPWAKNFEETYIFRQDNPESRLTW